MFKKGDKVRLTKDQKALHYGDEVFKTGETGTLGRRYRIQDGLEVWHLVLDKARFSPYTFIAVAHTDIEKVTPGDGSQLGEDMLGEEEGFQ